MTIVPEPPGHQHESAAPGSGDSSSRTIPESSQAAGSPPAPAPALRHLLGLRVAAALIDVALLTGLFVIMGLVTGGTPAPTPGVASWSVGSAAAGTWWIRLGEATVAGWWLAAYLALVLAYFFASEATTGMTVGKRLLGLRVACSDGTRPPASAVAGRTLLRLVDWLPMLYLVGFLCVLATGRRQQRLGDLAASTLVGVAPSLPARRRHPLLAGTVAGLAIVALSVRVTSAGTPHLPQATAGRHCHGISFHHPAGWQQQPIQTRVTGTGRLCQTGILIGPSDGIAISAWRLPLRVTTTNLTTLTPDFTGGIRRLTRQAGGALQAGPDTITAGRLPALKFRASGLSYNGTRTETTLVLAFNGSTQYEIICQYTPQRAAQVTMACNQVLRTFSLTSPPA